MGVFLYSELFIRLLQTYSNVSIKEKEGGLEATCGLKFFSRITDLPQLNNNT